jgi:pheromone a factor receptor
MVPKRAERCLIPLSSRYYWSDSTLSQQHVRIHCVLYEQDSVTGIPPLVYATDVSRYGTFLKKSNSACASSNGHGIRMTQKSGSFLLDDGDQLRLSDNVTLTYRSIDPVEDDKLSLLQQREKEASRTLLRSIPSTNLE